MFDRFLNFSNFTDKHLYQSLFFNKIVDAAFFIKKEILAQVFSCKFWEIFKNIFFYKTLSGGCFWKLKSINDITIIIFDWIDRRYFYPPPLPKIGLYILVEEVSFDLQNIHSKFAEFQ